MSFDYSNGNGFREIIFFLLFRSLIKRCIQLAAKLVNSGIQLGEKNINFFLKNGCSLYNKMLFAEL